jgi:hypothetical protein
VDAVSRPEFNGDRWNLELECMPQADEAMHRLDAWYHCEIVDRAPIRFMAHNAFLETGVDYATLSPEERRMRWFDVEYQVDLFERSIEGRAFHGETFPVFWPNLGPNVYAAFYGLELEFGEVTSWSRPIVRNWSDVGRLRLDTDNMYWEKIEELTRHALDRCQGRYLVGYTDLHPGIDCAAAWRGMDQLCIDMVDSPEQVQALAERAIADFETVYDHFDAMLKARGQPSSSWMCIPSFGRMHIPSCDFAALISPRLFQEYGLPILEREVQSMTHNIFHLDGKGVARHLDTILSVPEIHAIQWVQGVGDDQPIMQWMPFIKALQARGVPVIVDLSKEELDDFTAAMNPEGLFLWVATESEEEELALLRKIERWTGSQSAGGTMEEVTIDRTPSELGQFSS